MLRFALLLSLSVFGQLHRPEELLRGPMEWRTLPLATHTVHRAEAGGRQFNLHSYITHFGGKFWAVWSASPVDEDSDEQVVLYSTSADGKTWTRAANLTTDPPGDGRWIARGVYVADGELTALAAYMESADYGNRGEGDVWKNLRLMRFVWTGSAWAPRGVFAENCMNNFPPETLNGTLAMVCRDSRMDVSMALRTGAKWTHTKLAAEPPNDRMDEPAFYATRGAEVHMIVRDNTRSGFLLRAVSRDHGRTWTAPVRTNYPDATSKNFPGKLSNGWHYLISNPVAARRDPLTISFSRDGWTFSHPMAVRQHPPDRRYAGRAKGSGSVQYPHAVEHNGSLWVIYATNKEDIEVTEIPLAKMGLEERAETKPFEVVVYGGTPGGVAAAVTAARAGRQVALVEPHKHLGGMTVSGLGKSDIETREAIGGLFREFTSQIREHYVEHLGPEGAKLSRDGYYYEPSVALRVMRRLVDNEKRITVLTNHRLVAGFKSGSRLAVARVKDRETERLHDLRAPVFIDASYEGDLAAYALARYRLGRESRQEFNEPHAGVIYQNHETREILPGSTGEGDRRLPAYTYRLCLTSNPENSVPLTGPPPEYDRARYTGYLDDWKAGRFAPPKEMRDGVGYYAPTFHTVVRALSFAELPNRKFDVNMNPRPLGFPFAELNENYVEADWEDRARIEAHIRNVTLGLLYFLQNDAAIPEAHRALARQYLLAKDEFPDNGHFPFQLYIREARRLAGLYTLSENDTILQANAQRTQAHADSIAAGEFPVDSFPVRRAEAGRGALEGYIFMLDRQTKPYQIPYRVMLPEAVNGLLVPVAASTTHVAFSTVRMEPTWMAMGQAAGLAAHLAVRADIAPRALEPGYLQRELLKLGQVITYFKDIDRAHPNYAALQYWGARGFFTDYFARANDPVSDEVAKAWARISGRMIEHAGLTRGALCQRLYELAERGGSQPQ
ncbi:MAG: FAD-dependent oxidoreductase [Acidobacteria bacterium]|nr:FAD-dependent oxidoreductase [Acidobacteriota bacterium]